MAETQGIQEVVDRIVGQVVEQHATQLRERLVQQVLSAVGEPATGTSASGELFKAVSAIHQGSGQREILKNLLDHVAGFCGRTALFVVKGGVVVGWQGRGFVNSADLKDFALEGSGGLVEQAMQQKAVALGDASNMDAGFIGTFGAPASDMCVLAPLMLKEKVAALLYADAGSEHSNKVDQAAIEMLVMTTGIWLEVLVLRKGAPAGASAVQDAAQAEATLPVPMMAAAAEAPAAEPIPSEPVVASAEAAGVDAQPVELPMAAAAASGGSASASASAAELPEVHRKAQRFARLLVDEIKLYNHAKVEEGRKHHDLYDRLKEDIEKSRTTYHKRYGNTDAASVDYFRQELVRSLGQDDASVFGPNFRR